MATIIKVPVHRWLKTERSRRMATFGTIVLVLLILAAIGIGIYYYLKSVEDRKASDAQHAAETSYKQSYQETLDVNKLSAAAQTKALKGDVAGATNDMLAAINAPSTSTNSRITLYQLLAFMLANATKYDDALKYAQKSEDLAKNRQSAKVLGDIAMQKSDKPLAAKWYKLAVERFSADEKAQLPGIYDQYVAALEGATR